MYAGIDEIHIVAKLESYIFSPPKIVPTATQNFKLTTIDPCKTTIFSIVPFEIENFVTFAGYKI